MSKYTTELRFICESVTGLKVSKGYTDVNEIISSACSNIFNFDFPIFDETYRKVIETKILRHYYTREICEETYGLWKLRLQDRLNLIMPYYNKLYESELLKFNPFYDVDLTRSHSRKNDGKQTRVGSAKEDVNEGEARSRNEEQKSEARGNDKAKSRSDKQTEKAGNSATTNTELHWDLYSDTPQGGIAGIEGEAISGTVANNTYLSTARKNTANDTTSVTTGEDTVETFTDEQESETAQGANSELKVGEKNERNINRNTKDRSESELNNLEQYAERVIGKQGTLSYSKMLQEFRSTFINIDLMVINELSDLFFGLW